MPIFRNMIALICSLAVVQPCAAASALDRLLAEIPGAALSDGRSSIDRKAARGEGALSPSALAVYAPMVLVGTKTLQAADAAELLAWMKHQAPAVRIGHAGPWSASLECALQLEEMLEIKLSLVQAQSVGQAIEKLKAGTVDILCEAAPTVLDDVRAGEMVAFVLASDERLPALWDVTTADQAGLPLFAATAWLGLYAPSPDSAAIRLQKSLSDDIVQALADMAWSVFPAPLRTPDAHRQQMQAEADRRKAKLTDDGLPIGR